MLDELPNTKIAAMFIHIILRLRTMHHHTKAGYNKRQSGSESIFYELMMVHYPIKFGYKNSERVVQKESSTCS